MGPLRKHESLFAVVQVHGSHKAQSRRPQHRSLPAGGCIKVTSMLDDTPPGAAGYCITLSFGLRYDSAVLCGGGVGAHEQPPATASNVSRSILGQ